MNRLISIGEAAEVLGVSITTLLRWEVEGKMIPERTTCGYHRYDLTKLKSEMFHEAATARRTIAYARVSSDEQKADLERRNRFLNYIVPGRVELWKYCLIWVQESTITRMSQ